MEIGDEQQALRDVQAVVANLSVEERATIQGFALPLRSVLLHGSEGDRYLMSLAVAWVGAELAAQP
jgi:hypothetical protein